MYSSAYIHIFYARVHPLMYVWIMKITRPKNESLPHKNIEKNHYGVMFRHVRVMYYGQTKGIMWHEMLLLPLIVCSSICVFYIHHESHWQIFHLTLIAKHTKHL